MEQMNNLASLNPKLLSFVLLGVHILFVLGLALVPNGEWQTDGDHQQHKECDPNGQLGAELSLIVPLTIDVSCKINYT